LIDGHRQARAAIKELRPAALVGQVNSMQEWESNAGGRRVMEYARRMSEGVFLEDSGDDDFVGVNTYTRAMIEVPRLAGLAAAAALAIGPIERRAVERMVAGQTSSGAPIDPRPDIRRTDMGYEFRPEAVAATVRRVAALYPGKPILVTEHGIAATDDAERIEFITGGLQALQPLIGEGIPLRGYIHWSAFDNFEWERGYAMEFGLIAVDRETQERQPKPSARFLGEVARTNKLVVADS
jgi:beta-glucosidase